MSLASTHHELDELGGGRFRHTQHMRAVGYRQGGALLRSIHDWAQGDATWPHVIQYAPMLVYLRNGMARVCPTREPLRYLEFGMPFIKVGGVWTQVNLGSPTRTGNKVSWSTAQADVWCQFGGHKLDIGKARSKGGWRPPNNQIAYPVGVNGLTRTGTTFLQDGVPVMSLQAPTVADADNPMDVRPVQTQLVQVSGQWYAVMTLPDMAGWADWELDPTLTLQPNAADGVDTMVAQIAANTNYATSNELYTRQQSGVQYRPLYKFNLTSIPPTATITAATLTLTVKTAVNTTTWEYFFAILAANNAWTEAGATWNYALASTIRWVGDTGGDGGTDAGCSVAGTDYDAAQIGAFVHVANDPAGTAYSASLAVATVQAWLTANYGLVQRQDSATQTIWASSDHVTTAWRPQVVIAYTLPGGGARRMFIPDLGHIQMRGA